MSDLANNLIVSGVTLLTVAVIGWIWGGDHFFAEWLDRRRERRERRGGGKS